MPILSLIKATIWIKTFDKTKPIKYILGRFEKIYRHKKISFYGTQEVL